MEQKIFYCVKCKEKKVCKDYSQVTFRNRRGKKIEALVANCPDCGTRMYKIVGRAYGRNP
jgi:ssDNA-binding Zn-finger/Zn-ribbon topoisomerase 1